MAISVPVVPVYYYECSNGKFRLTYFIPFQNLKKLVEKGKINSEVLKDFPDGLDLDCTEPDFKEFELLYGYRPEYSPEAMCNSFLAIFSSTKNWKSFRGTGYIHIEDLERNINKIKDDLHQKKLTPDQVPTLSPNASFTTRRSRVRKKLNLQSNVEKYLREFKIPTLDKTKDLKEQSLTEIEMESGKEKPNEFYRRIQLKQKLKDG